MANRFKLENGVLTLVNEKNEVIYESKPTPIKKSFLDKTADFIRDLPEIPTPSFLKLSPEPGSSSTESETNTTEVSTTEANTDATTVAVTSDAANPVTEETEVTDVNVVQSDQPNPEPVSEKQPEQPEVKSEPKRTEVPETVEAKIEAKVG